ncbi:MAG: TetR/AcrR family transcriptional regulator [Arenicella sp.]|jgi:AcrR family transcriptional regulator|nr:TetR/AcrR family transcriptional regulator [Arenicella sp.]
MQELIDAKNSTISEKISFVTGVSVSSMSENHQLSRVDTSSYTRFLETFPLQGNALFTGLFERHGDVIQTQKAKFAVANLEKILSATFEISANSGFSRMSLRDLSKKAEMSMGAIYSCIERKEDIVLMVADIVRLSSQMTSDHATASDSLWTQIEQSIRYHLYASTLLQPWYFFLYFETRSLPVDQQQASTRIELDAIDSFQGQIEAGIESGQFTANNPRAIANSIVVLLEDWYLKPWKTQLQSSELQTNQQREEIIDAYYLDLITMTKSLLGIVE